MSTKQKRLVVINVVGLTPSMLGSETPNLNSLVKEGFACPLHEVFPAVTATAQTSMLTGLLPCEHGIVGNGWYFRDQAEVRFWLQSNHLVQGQRIWQLMREREPGFKTSKLFWWYNMYASVDHSITPRPHYPADGRKIMGLYSDPPDLQAEVERRVGVFPFFNFWGPLSGIEATRWIVSAAIEEFSINHSNLQLVYLPHLDYNLQRLGPNDPRIAEDVRAVDREAGRLIDAVRAQGADVMVVSEYGIEAVSQSIALNRILREHGFVRVRESVTWELLDPGASRAFAVSDHQAAHVYVKDPADIEKVRRVLSDVPGIAHVLGRDQQADWGIDHARSGELVLVAEPGCWFNYYYWLDESKAPDFARTVDIHRKPGFDPVELFIDPNIRFPKLKAYFRLAQKKLGMRMLMDLIPLDPGLIRGSHGRLLNDPDNGPLLISTDRQRAVDALGMQEIKQFIAAYYR